MGRRVTGSDTLATRPTWIRIRPCVCIAPDVYVLVRVVHLLGFRSRSSFVAVHLCGLQTSTQTLVILRVKVDL